MKLRFVAGIIVAGLLAPGAAAAAVTSSYDSSARRLVVESDADDPIVVACAGSEVTVNGLRPDSGAIECGRIVQLVVRGGPGANRIDLARMTFGSTGSKGVNARVEVSAGAGDDHVIGPEGWVLVRLDGGAGDDRLEGRSLDTYLFGAAAAPETDTIVEPGSSSCEPTAFDTVQHNRSYWTVPWDGLDFSTLGPGDDLSVVLSAPGGLLAQHRNRTVRLEAPSAQSFEAVAGGAGDDVISGACLTTGGDGDDRITGSPTGDLLDGGRGNDTLLGLSGPDSLQGGVGTDTLAGGAGADKLVGSGGDDTLAGGAGSDVYVFGADDGAQHDVAVEGPVAGVDVLSYLGAAPVRIDLSAPRAVLASAAGLRVVASSGSEARFEGAIGGSGNDVLLGNGRANHLWGGGGVDLADGRGGNDTYHVDWSGSMPYSAYGIYEFWSGPFGGRPSLPGWSPFDTATRPQSRLRILERAGEGRDTLDLAERFLVSEGYGGRLEGQIRSTGARVDLSGKQQLVRAGRVSAVAATPHTPAQLENVRGTQYDDTIVGNAAVNVLEGRFGRDRIAGGRGFDACLTHRGEDVLRGCERVRPRDPDR